jgi:hypothetical protein
MEINEQEARLVYGAIKVMDMEADESPEGNALKERICNEFTSIGTDVKRVNHENNLWSVVVEQNLEVINIRKELDELLNSKPRHGYEKWNARIEVLHQSLMDAKQRIYDELKEKETTNE